MPEQATAESDDLAEWARPDPGSSISPEQWANNLRMSPQLNMTCTSLGADGATFVVSAPPLADNPNGSVHGGMLAAIADHAMSILAAWVKPAGTIAFTGALNVQYHRPAIAPLALRAYVIMSGRRASFIELEIRADDGRRCASAQATMIVNGRVGVGR